MKKLLITGFEAFGGEALNPSWQAVKSLPEHIGGYELTKQLLPVVFGRASDVAIKAAEEISPHAVLCIGQAGGRDAVTPELVGINLRYASTPDNSGKQPLDEPIVPGGAEARFSTLPVRKIADAINAVGVPAKVSYTAGAYVCNDVLYCLLTHFNGTDTAVGFIHVPYCTEQGKEPCMELDAIVKAITAAIESISDI
jgi:pyroglutamyl-peptidase